MTPEELFLSMKIAELGIIPETATAEEFNALMETLTPEQRKSAKRKFRKLWRKSRKDLVNLSSKEKRPTKNIKRRRRSRVFSDLRKKVRTEISRIK